MAGLEVEELKPVAPPFTNIVVGEIKEAIQHPNADRLQICKVDVGRAALLDIVCGAPKRARRHQSALRYGGYSCRQERMESHS